MSNADLAAKRANLAAGAVSPRDMAPQPVFKKRRVTAELDPRMFSHQVGMVAGDENDPVLSQAHKAFESLSKTLDETFERELTIRQDSTRTEADHMLAAAKLAEKHLTVPTQSLDGARASAVETIREIDREVERTFKSHLTESERSEIRSHIKGLSDKQRREFLASADDDVVASVLSAKPFLSGLKPAEAETLRHQVIQRRFPQAMKRRQKLQKAQEQLEAGMQKFMREMGALRDPRADAIAKRAKAAQDALK